VVKFFGLRSSLTNGDVQVFDGRILDPKIAVGSSRCLALTNAQRKISANLKLAFAREMESAFAPAFAPVRA